MNKARELTGRHVLIMLFAFFGVMFAVNAVFVTMSLKSFPGETAEKSYLHGLNYNDVLAERAAQAQLGWRAQVTAAGSDQIEVSFSDANGLALTGLAITSEIIRPAHANTRQEAVFSENGDGVYIARFRSLATGAWDLAGEAVDGNGDKFLFTARVLIE
ncbi:MAG: FixH family protein [Marinicaulis sp.]|nr:FixH family protein [Marinicaulis sp.]NNE41443.1 FixH family protein [Marinicaulis sp.]NNL89234.1 FixH family protein [Marinicaulis sp.]